MTKNFPSIKSDPVRNKRRNRRAKNEKKFRAELKADGDIARNRSRLARMSNEVRDTQRYWKIFEGRKKAGHTCENAARCDCEVSR